MKWLSPSPAWRRAMHKVCPFLNPSTEVPQIRHCLFVGSFLGNCHISQRQLVPFGGRYTELVQHWAVWKRAMDCDRVTFFFSFNECSFYLFPLPDWGPQGNPKHRCRMIYMLIWHKQAAVTTKYLFCSNWSSSNTPVFHFWGSLVAIQGINNNRNTKTKQSSESSCQQMYPCLCKPHRACSKRLQQYLCLCFSA